MTRATHMFHRKIAAIKLSLLYSCAAMTLYHPASAAESVQSQQGDTGDEHIQFVKKALAETLCEGNLQIVQEGSAYQSKPGSEAAKEARRHFAIPDLTKCLSYIDREKKLALNYSSDADSNVEDRARALFHLGMFLHCTQDFYCKSNYIDLRVDSMQAKHKTVDPYDMELVDWSKLETSGVESGSPEFEKCIPGPEAEKKANGEPYRSIVSILAVRETQRQWNLFEALIRLKYQGRATAIITALKMASCPANTLKTVLQDIP